MYIYTSKRQAPARGKVNVSLTGLLLASRSQAHVERLLDVFVCLCRR